MVFNAASLRDFAAFSFCRLPVVRSPFPSTIVSLCLFRR
jgi:hypothetical protein